MVRLRCVRHVEQIEERRGPKKALEEKMKEKEES